MFKIHSEYKPTGDQPQAIEYLSKGIQEGKKFQTLLGVTGSGKTFTMANIIEKVQKPTLVLAHNKTLAGQLYSEFKEFFPENRVEYFVSYYDYYQPEAYIAASDTYIEKDASINDEIDKLRHSATASLFESKDVIIIASVSCIYGLGDPIDYEHMIVSLRPGMEKPRNEIMKKLVNMQYSRNEMDFKRGTFRAKGDILEIYPSNQEESAIRVEFWGDEIDSIRKFSISTQRTVQMLEEIEIFPSFEFLLETDVDTVCEKIMDKVYPNSVKEKVQDDVYQIKNGEFLTKIDKYFDYFYNKSETFLDYLDKDYIIFLDEASKIKARSENIIKDTTLYIKMLYLTSLHILYRFLPEILYPCFKLF